MLILSAAFFIGSVVSFKIPNDKSIIINGDSHTGCAINDSIFTHAINISQGGKNYLFTYLELRKFLEVNHHISTVILSFSRVNSIGFYNDIDLSFRIPSRFPLLQKDDVLSLIDINRKVFFNSILKSPRLFIALYIFKKGTITYKDLQIGGYMKLDWNKLESDIELRNNREITHTNEMTRKQQIHPQYEHGYLLKIVELCREKNVKLILFNSPIYNPDKYGNKTALTKYIDNYLSEIKYLDFSDFALPVDGYGDIIHLNYKGAEIFSRYLEDNYETIFEN
jgi:hypothetical protein